MLHARMTNNFYCVEVQFYTPMNLVPMYFLQRILSSIKTMPRNLRRSNEYDLQCSVYSRLALAFSCYQFHVDIAMSNRMLYIRKIFHPSNKIARGKNNNLKKCIVIDYTQTTSILIPFFDALEGNAGLMANGGYNRRMKIGRIATKVAKIAPYAERKKVSSHQQC